MDNVRKPLPLKKKRAKPESNLSPLPLKRKSAKAESNRGPSAH